MDEIDDKIVALLKKDGRLPFVDIAKKLDLTEGAVRARVKKLIDSKAIERFTVDVKNDTKAVVMVGTSQAIPTSKVAQAIRELGVSHVYEVSGNFDIICFIQANSTADLNGIIEKIRAIKGVIDTSTSMVLK